MIDIDFLGNFGESGIQKGDPFRSELYREYVKMQPCCITEFGGVEFHHLIYQSRGGQSSDIFGVPLVPRLHHEYHYVYARKRFTERYRVVWNAIVYGLWRGFFAQYRIDIEVLLIGCTDRKEVIAVVEAKIREVEQIYLQQAA